MQVVLMPLEKLLPADYNPRLQLKSSDRRYRKLRHSLKEFGLVEPLVWNRRSGRLIGGHQRLQILRELGVAEVPVSVVDLPPARERALNILLNNRQAQSDYDLERLTPLLSRLNAGRKPQLRWSGFSRTDLARMRSRFAPARAASDRPPNTTGENNPSQWLEIVLRLPKQLLEKIRPDIDRLIAAHRLESHVRHAR
jgi:ParB-like chromosome segregation protein Spo0J